MTTLEKNSPGGGVFSFESDREKVAGIVRELVKQKLLYCLRKGDLVSYRFLLNEQFRIFRNLPIQVFDGFLIGCDEFDASHPSLLKAEVSKEPKLASFLYQMGFSHIAERDVGGFSPICYAAVRGDPLLLESLLRHRADPNDRVCKTCPKLGISRNTSLLAVCAFNGHNECLRVLIARRAGVDAKDAIKSRPLHAACGANNAEAVRMLCAEGADLSLKTARSCLSLTPFATACTMGCVQSMKVLLEAPQPLNLMLYLMMATQNASVESAATLLQARADINERFCPKARSTLWMVNAAMRLKHRWRPTTFTWISVNSWGATPLMVSIVAGLFDVAAFLIVARADLEIRNTRNKTALTLAEEMQVPDFLRMALSGAGRTADLAHEISGGPVTGSATLNMLPFGSLVTLEL